MVPGLSFLAGLLIPSPTAALRRPLAPNTYAPRLPDQLAVSQSQGVLKGGLSGMSGAEADPYADVFGPAAIRSSGAPIVQDVTSKALPPCWFTAGDPGADPDEPTVLADFDRSPQTGGYHGADYGGSTRSFNIPAQLVRPGWLPTGNAPGRATPNAREMQAARDGQPDPVRDAYLDLWSD